MPYQLVSDLPKCLIDALKSVSYNKKDIEIFPREKISILCAGGDGRRGFAILVDLYSREYKAHFGSWGGANIFNPGNQVDLNDQSYPIPENGAVILGSEGNTTFATIYLNPKNVAPFLTSGTELSEDDRKIMYAYGCLKSGTYRNEELSLLGIFYPKDNKKIRSLIDRGFLKQDGRGIQITLAGKNTRKASVGSGQW